eukprot:scaffold39285_cov70-Cyclotella_meneghiniana.AAC.4
MEHFSALAAFRQSGLKFAASEGEDLEGWVACIMKTSKSKLIWEKGTLQAPGLRLMLFIEVGHHHEGHGGKSVKDAMNYIPYFKEGAVSSQWKLPNQSREDIE